MVEKFKRAIEVYYEQEKGHPELFYDNDENFYYLIKHFNSEYLNDDKTIANLLLKWNLGKTDNEEGFEEFCEDVAVLFEMARDFYDVPYLIALTFLRAYITGESFEEIEEDENLRYYFYDVVGE